ncbi:MAG: hypothetical protein VX153_00470 [Verrucomicrobiota bacterium]|nr:hypothetical protein [Verrucomicrobiota bacterium]
MGQSGGNVLSGWTTRRLIARFFMSTTKIERARELANQARSPHRGVYLTGPNEVKVLEDELRPESLNGENYLLASFGNCRCASDAKAIRQFDAHARVPSGVDRIALGHETLQLVLEAPEGSNVGPGDIVVVTPGHATEPIDPMTFQPSKSGVLSSLGYSYRYLGGLRQFNIVPANAPAFVKAQGFGNFFNSVSPAADTSLITLAHAEPFACNYGTNKHIFTIGEDGNFKYGVPSRAIVAYLSGTARMAMINLTIVASVADEDLPPVVYVTGSQAKLDEMEDYALIRDLRKRGTRVVLIDRKDQDILAKLVEFGRPEVVWTNYASAETYEQASAIMAEGGNLNSYAGAVDPELTFSMPIAKAPSFSSLEEEAKTQVNQMHHNVSPNDPTRHRGLAKEPRVALLGLEPNSERESAYLNQFPKDIPVLLSLDLSEPDGLSQYLQGEGGFTDVFIAGTGADAATIYESMETLLARSAAVNFIDGEVDLKIRSKNAHYVTRHQICGKNVPWHMTNTSEPHADDMLVQASKPVSFDWMVKGICGLRNVPAMMDEVESAQPFGSFYAFAELEDLPYVECTSTAFKQAAESSDGPVKLALTAGAEVLESTGNVWSRKVEEALYAGYGLPYPLSLT